MRVPVLIAGGGPVGLSLAVELGHRGIEALLVDQGDGVVDFTTANLVNTRTVEHLRRWGIAEAARFSGFPPDYPRAYRYITSFAGYELASFEHPANGYPAARSRFSPESRLWCPKVYFDPLLLETVRGLRSVRIRFNTRVEKFDEGERGVRVWLTDGTTGHTEVVEADYLAACDGGKSSIRKQLGIGLSGQFAEQRNVAISVRSPLAEHRRVGSAVYYGLVGPRARGVVTSVDGDQQWRINVWHNKNYELSAMDEAEACRRALGPGVPFEVVSNRDWAGHCVVADSYGTDRVFLVGDAAHLPWPAGGFGMNTGLGDAVDLGWKLAATIDGWAGPGLLRSYEAERRPIGLRNIAYAESLHRDDTKLNIPADLDADTTQSARVRAELAATIKASREKEFGLESPAVELGYSYADSPVVVPDRDLPEDIPTGQQWHQTSAVGVRAPHGWLADGTSTLDLFGPGFTLLCVARANGHPVGGEGIAHATTARGVPLRVARVQDDEVWELYQRRLVLVRPDGHVAWRGDEDPDQPMSIVNTVRGAV